MHISEIKYLAQASPAGLLIDNKFPKKTVRPCELQTLCIIHYMANGDMFIRNLELALQLNMRQQQHRLTVAKSVLQLILLIFVAINM